LLDRHRCKIGFLVQYFSHERRGLRLKHLDLLGRQGWSRDFDRYERHRFFSNSVCIALTE
jgi:hypothetical protein